MQIDKAMQILAVNREAEFAEIKKKYRRLMIKYHPDAIGSDLPECLKMAQEINEAYRILQVEYENIRKALSREKSWNAKINEQAFAERTIFMPYTLEHDLKDLYQDVCRGRYMWNPDEEEFSLLLRSVRLASAEVLKQSEEKCNLYYSEPEWEKIRFPYQVKIFQMMMQQYIQPYECIRKLWEPVCADDRHCEIYEFRGFLSEKGKTKVYRNIMNLKKGEQLLLSFSSENRIAAWNALKEGLGFLSLEEDALYFLLLPLLREHIAQIKVRVNETSAKQRRGFAQAKADLSVRVRIMPEAQEYVFPMKNIEIAAVLKQYEQTLRKQEKC